MAYEVLSINNSSPPQNISPTTSWSTPASIFGATPQENTSSFYTWSNFGSQVTLPLNGLADGYLFIGHFEYEDTSNGRFQPQAKFNNTASGGSFVSAQTGGYNRSNTEDRSYVRTLALELNPQSGGVFTFQWKRDGDAPTGGLISCGIEVVPLYFNDAAIFESNSASIYGGTTPNQITGFTESLAGTNISFASNTVSLESTASYYLCFGSYFFEGFGSTRTQRWGGFRIDGTKDDESKAVSYYRNNNNDENGSFFTNIISGDSDIDMFCYRGDGVANNQGGADVDGGTPVLGYHFMAFIELKPGCRIFKTSNENSANESISTANASTLNFTATESVIQTPFVSDGRSDTLGLNIPTSSQKRLLLGANIGGASPDVTSTTRYTGFTEFGFATTSTEITKSGDYLRGNQGSSDTFGWSSNMLSYYNYGWTDVADTNIYIEATALSTSAKGPAAVIGGWLGAWGLDLETMNDDTVPSSRRLLIVR